MAKYKINLQNFYTLMVDEKVVMWPPTNKLAFHFLVYSATLFLIYLVYTLQNKAVAIMHFYNLLLEASQYGLLKCRITHGMIPII